MEWVDWPRPLQGDQTGGGGEKKYEVFSLLVAFPHPCDTSIDLTSLSIKGHLHYICLAFKVQTHFECFACAHTPGRILFSIFSFSTTSALIASRPASLLCYPIKPVSPLSPCPICNISFVSRFPKTSVLARALPPPSSCLLCFALP